MYEDEGSCCKVEVANGVHILLLELTDGGVVAGEYVVVNGGEVGWAFLKLAGVDG